LFLLGLDSLLRFFLVGVPFFPSVLVFSGVYVFSPFLSPEDFPPSSFSKLVPRIFSYLVVGSVFLVLFPDLNHSPYRHFFSPPRPPPLNLTFVPFLDSRPRQGLFPLFKAFPTEGPGTHLLMSFFPHVRGSCDLSPLFGPKFFAPFFFRKGPFFFLPDIAVTPIPRRSPPLLNLLFRTFCSQMRFSESCWIPLFPTTRFPFSYRFELTLVFFCFGFFLGARPLFFHRFDLFADSPVSSPILNEVSFFSPPRVRDFN